MASRASIRPLFGAARSSLRRSVRPQSSAIAAASTYSTQSNPFSNAPTQDPQPTPDPVDVPRWKQTPRAMVAPTRLRPVTPGNEWRVNQDPRKLDEAYTRMLGNGGGRLLSEDVKWLAVTHKSFDHGRRGFNDRLAYLGRRIVELQTSLALLSMPPISPKARHVDSFGREPFKHKSLDGLQNLSIRTKEDIVGKDRLAGLASQYGFEYVIRWKPKRADNLRGSGIESVLAETLYAIVGALALQKGGDIASKTVREKILAPLGISKP